MKILITAFLVFLLLSCSNKSHNENVNYNIGNYVYIKPDSMKGIVVAINKNNNTFIVSVKDSNKRIVYTVDDFH